MTALADHYRTLGVHRQAEPMVIAASYRALARNYHPDVYPDKQAAEERLKQLNEAFSVLPDPNKRVMYDRAWDAQNAPRRPPVANSRPSTPPKPPAQPRSAPPAKPPPKAQTQAPSQPSRTHTPGVGGGVILLVIVIILLIWIF
jgi:curved DNA-binding protein CbpA